MPQYPGEVVDDIGRSLTTAAKGLVSNISAGLRTAGDQVQQALDVPADALNLENSPFRIVHDPLEGSVRSTENSINQGFLNSLEIFWGAVTDGLDRVPKTFAAGGGLPMPPRLGKRR